jgi:hypothetical protein
LVADDRWQSGCGGDRRRTQNRRGNPSGNTHTECQTTNKLNKQNMEKNNGEAKAKEEGTEEAGHKRGKMAEEKGVKHRTEAREHQINCLAQMVDDKGRR